MKIEDVVFVIFLIISIVLFLWFIFGNSPTLEQALLSILIGLSVKNHGDIREIKGRFGEHLRIHK